MITESKSFVRVLQRRKNLLHNHQLLNTPVVCCNCDMWEYFKLLCYLLSSCPLGIITASYHRTDNFVWGLGCTASNEIVAVRYVGEHCHELQCHRKHFMLLTLDECNTFVKCFATDIWVYCGALRQEDYKQNCLSVPKDCIQILWEKNY